MGVSTVSTLACVMSADVTCECTCECTDEALAARAAAVGSPTRWLAGIRAPEAASGCDAATDATRASVRAASASNTGDREADGGVLAAGDGSDLPAELPPLVCVSEPVAMMVLCMLDVATMRRGLPRLVLGLPAPYLCRRPWTPR